MSTRITWLPLTSTTTPESGTAAGTSPAGLVSAASTSPSSCTVITDRDCPVPSWSTTPPSSPSSVTPCPCGTRAVRGPAPGTGRLDFSTNRSSSSDHSSACRLPPWSTAHTRPRSSTTTSASGCPADHGEPMSTSVTGSALWMVPAVRSTTNTRPWAMSTLLAAPGGACLRPLASSVDRSITVICPVRRSSTMSVPSSWAISSCASPPLICRRVCGLPELGLTCTTSPRWSSPSQVSPSDTDTAVREIPLPNAAPARSSTPSSAAPTLADSRPPLPTTPRPARTKR